MFNLLLKKILSSTLLNGINSTILSAYKVLCAKINFTNECKVHLQNILVLITSYSVVSILLYPELNFGIYLKEVFSLLCAYGAIFVWFLDRITPQIRYKVAIGVTACVAPIFFVNNSFSVALIEIVLIIFSEFLLFEYIRGCNIFSDSIPVYIFCENCSDLEFAKNLSGKYKILELALFSKNDEENNYYSSLKSINDLKKWLEKIKRIPFYPMPRRFMYFSQRPDIETLTQLLEISAEFSIPLFKASKNGYVNQTGSTNTFSGDAVSIIPVCLSDFEFATVSSQEKSALSSALKGKHIWITYDGRGIILDLICSIQASMTSANIVILCESEKLATEVDNELGKRRPSKGCKIKIMDLNLMCHHGSRPDILFYNLPIKSFNSSDDNLKEAVIKNVLDTDKMIQFSQQVRIPFVFIFSSSEALNSNNWIGATQRLGELLTQYADSKSRKLYTKFKAIRIPNSTTDIFGVSSKIVSSILTNGHVNIDFTDSELEKVYHRSDILPPLIKIISSSLKEYDSSHSVYTITPKKGISIDGLIKIICNVFCIQKDKEVKVSYNRSSEIMELESFPNISESLEKTNIADVMSTKFLNTKPENYESIWSIEQINLMTTRELVSVVFQSLSEKVKG